MFRGTCDAPGESGAVGGYAHLTGAPPLQAIGTIPTATGLVTVMDARGVVAQVKVGDPVYRHDTIETGADGTVGITFIDGTAFNLSNNARMALNEFVCDETSNSALFSLSKGVFAFIAGKVAKAGGLRIDTPFARIRGAAQDGGIGILTLAALAFSTIRELQAASRSDAFVDDGIITYKESPHGTFEITTRDGRVIVADDPGETVVVDPAGSVTRIPNSSSRMAELQQAQQNALSTLSMGLGQQGAAPGGSSTDTQFAQQQLLPINFSQLQNHDAAPLAVTITTQTNPGAIDVPQQQFKPPPPPPPPTIAISTIAGQISVAADNIINASKANAGVNITGTTSHVEDGQIVTITIVDGSNHVVYSTAATVTNDTWSINVSSAAAKLLADGSYTLKADVSNAAGLQAQASQAITVDETPPTIAIGAIIANNVVNVSAANAGFAITGTTSDAENGQPVTVNVVDSSGQIVESFTTTVTNNAWSVNLSSSDAKLLHDGSYTVTADVSDAAGNLAPTATQAITVDETPPTVTWLPQAESGTEGTAIALGTITATANSLPGHSNSVQSLVVSGIPIGAVLTDGTNNFMAMSGNTSVDVKSWNLSALKITPPNDTNFILTVTATDQDANTASTSELVTVAPVAPNLSAAAAPTTEDHTSALTITLSNAAQLFGNGDSVTVTVALSDGATLSQTGSGALVINNGNGTFTLTAHSVADLSGLTITPASEFEGSLTLTVAATAIDAEGNVSTTVTATEVVTVNPVAETPVLTAPATVTTAENEAGSPNPVPFSGTNLLQVTLPTADQDDSITVTLHVANGTLALAAGTDTSGLSSPVSGIGTATLTFTGLQSAVDTVLAGLQYMPTAEFEGTDTLTFTALVTDTASGLPTSTATGSTSVTINVNPVAEPPTATAPATATTSVNSAIDISGVVAGPTEEDLDDKLIVLLTVNQGTLSVSAVAGVTETGNASGSLTVSGPASAVNTALASLIYTPTTNFAGSDTLNVSVTSQDGSNTYPTQATATTTLNIKASTLTIPAGSTTTLNGGTLQASIIDVEGTVTGFGTIIANVITNNGTITAKSSHTLTIEISGSITGTGTLDITNNTTLILDGPVGSGQTVLFQVSQGAVGVLVLGDPSDFQGQISGFLPQDKIDLTNINSATAKVSSVSFDSSTNITTLVITDGQHTDTLKLVGDYTPPAHTFTFSSDGSTGTIVVDPPASTTTTDATTTTNALTTTTGGLTATTDVSTTTTDASTATTVASTTTTDATVTPVAQASTLTATKTTSRQTKATSATVTETASSRTNANSAAAAADEAIMVALNTAVAVAVALDTAVADPDSGKTSSLSGNDTAVDITGTVSGSDSSIIDSGAALKLSPVSLGMAGTLTENGTIEAINGKPAGAVSETGAFKIDAAAALQLDGSDAVDGLVITDGTNADAINLPGDHTTKTAWHASDDGRGGKAAHNAPVSETGEDASAQSTSADNHFSVSSPLTATPSGHGDHTASAFKPNADHDATVDPGNLASIPKEQLPQHPADNLLHIPAQPDHGADPAQSASADDGNAHQGAVPSDPPTLTALPGDSSGTHGPAAPAQAPGEDTPVQSAPADNGHHWGADPEIKFASIPQNHSLEHPADNSPHMQQDDNGSPAATDGAHPAHGQADRSDSASPKFADDGDAHPGKVSHEPPALTALSNDVSEDDPAHGAHTAHGQADKSDSASPKFADDGDAHPGKVSHEPPALTALPSDVSGDDPAKTNLDHHASADPKINDIANDHPSQNPADNSLHVSAQPDDYGSTAVTDGAHPGRGQGDGIESASAKFADDGSNNSGKALHDPSALTALPSDVSGDDPAKTNLDHHASADPKNNDIAKDLPPQQPADNSLHAPAQPDDNGSPAATDGAHPGRGQVDGGESASPNFADNGSAQSAHANGEDTSVPSALASNGHHGNADPEINLASIAPNQPPEHPADNLAPTPAQPDDGPHPADPSVDVNELPSFKFADNGSDHGMGPDGAHPVHPQVDGNQPDSFKFADGGDHPGTIPNDPTAVTAPSSDPSGTHGPAAPTLAKTLGVPDAGMSVAPDQFVFAENAGQQPVADHKSDMTEIDHPVPAEIQQVLDTAQETNAVSPPDPSHGNAPPDTVNVQAPYHQDAFHFV